MKNLFVIFIASFFCMVCSYTSACAQQISGVEYGYMEKECADSSQNMVSHKFTGRQLIVPTSLLLVGAIGSGIDEIKEVDFGINRLDKNKRFVVEDVTQYLPAASYYALRLCGLESTHNYRDASIILVLSCCITGAATKIIKEVSDVKRPNGLDDNSFPSGHTAVSFMGAEFLRREFKEVSPWIGVAGYFVATGSSLARIRHNEHWTTDLIAGAGIGILGTRIAYWIYPPLQRVVFGKIFKRETSGKMAFLGMPYYNGESTGLSLALHF